MPSKTTENGIVSSRTRLTALATERRLEQVNKSKAVVRLEELQLDIDELKIIQEILQTASKLLYANLSIKLGQVITEGLSLVFPESDLTFCVDFVERRNQIECDLFLTDTEGNKYDPINSVGGGITDFISILLRVTYITLSSNVNFIVADEPGKFISRDKVYDATLFLAKVCQDLDFEMLVVTHIAEMVEAASAVYKVTRKSKVSSIRKVR